MKKTNGYQFIRNGQRWVTVSQGNVIYLRLMKAEDSKADIDHMINLIFSKDLKRHAPARSVTKLSTKS